MLFFRMTTRTTEKVTMAMMMEQKKTTKMKLKFLKSD